MLLARHPLNSVSGGGGSAGNALAEQIFRARLQQQRLRAPVPVNSQLNTQLNAPPNAQLGGSLNSSLSLNPAQLPYMNPAAVVQQSTQMQIPPPADYQLQQQPVCY